MSPVRRIAAGLALAAIATLAIATPASAHDQLISSTPAAEERLASPPENITMTFSGELLILDASMTGAVVLVVDAAGKDWVAGDVTVTSRTVSVPLAPGMPEAGYQVRWQVVSEDGHPIAGVIPFTIGDAEPLTTTAVDGATAAPASAEQSDQVAADSGGILRVLLIGAGGAAVAVLVFALIRFLRRPRTAAAPPETGVPAADDL